jgi:hypothetical protein
MKFKYLAVALLALASMSEPVFADQRDEAYAALERWADAFNSGDVEKIVGTYTSDALVLGTLSPGLASKPDDLRSYFKPAVAAKFQVKLGDHSALCFQMMRLRSSDFTIFLELEWMANQLWSQRALALS